MIQIISFGRFKLRSLLDRTIAHGYERSGLADFEHLFPAVPGLYRNLVEAFKAEGMTCTAQR